MARRGHREGSIYRNRDGWAGALTVSEPGEPRRRKVVRGKTQAEVTDALRELRRRLDAGQRVDAPRLTVEGYLTTWLAVTLPAGNAKASTIDSYRSNAKLHIIPTLGQIELAKLRPPQVRAWLLSLRTKRSGRQPKDGTATLSARTIQYQHAILRAALADAVRDELIPRNVALLVEPPAAPKVKVEPLSEDEVTLLTAAARDRHAVLWLTMLATGLRRGEALALRWDDVDLEARTLTVARSLQRVRGEPDPITGRRSGRLVEVSVKTDASAATIALAAPLVDALVVHQRVQRLERIAARVWADPGLVFTTAVGSWHEPRNVNRAWAELCRRAGVRQVKLHALRHSTASFMLALGVPMKVVQASLRHSRMATTADVYSHVVEDLQRQGAEAMSGLLRRLPSQ